MLGAIIGDVCGSPYEHAPQATKDIDLQHPAAHFTDDSVLTVAVAGWLLDGGPLAQRFHALVARFPDAGYGAYFLQWARQRRHQPYQSWGNGAAMRVAPVGWYHQTLDAVLEAAADSAAVTHDHPEGIQGAQAVAAAVYLARTGADRDELTAFIEQEIGYDLDRSLAEIRPDYGFEVAANRSVPEAITCFLEAEDAEDAIRNAISLGGDADTQACIAGAIAEAFFGRLPGHLVAFARGRLPGELDAITTRFHQRHVGPRLPAR
jgi:ADP-ribosylglycohydrolase